MAKRRFAPQGASLEEKLTFFSEPHVSGRCQLWLGAKGRGYGQVWWEGRMISVHRATWVCEKGPIPDGLDVLHSCDNPPCRNIDHLFLGTHYDNVADMVAKGRQARGGRGPPGEGSGNAKLTEIEVLAIRAISGAVPQHVQATMYGVSQTTIWRIRHRRAWTHI
jgi:hypothetical protein